ncbi:S46 family peptidase [Rheinheimera sp. NSM]|uniref:S46 family peptidase n=1 Tax=Rheinheimera sp. NSM TaxID=3457884 RepID=UPI004036ACF8
MRIIHRSLTVLLALCSGTVQAGEGLWQPQQLPQILTADAVSSLLPGQVAALQQSVNAMAQVGDCSAAFVSANGLLLTSYHCLAQKLDSLQPAMSDSGFTALTPETELPLTGLGIAMMRQQQDVTLLLNRQLSQPLSPQQRSEKLQQLSRQLVSECQRQSGYRCELKSFHDGMAFYLLQYQDLDSVRLVHVPQRVVDGRNWSWPRYSANYVLLRAYQRNDQTVVPYRPAFLAVSARGVAENDAVIVAGFPQNSQRYHNAEQVRFQFEQLLPASLGYLQHTIELIERLAPPGSHNAQRYAAMLHQLKQSEQQQQAMLQQYRNSNLLAQKQQAEQQLIDWINGSPVRQQLYAPAISRFVLLQQQYHNTQLRDQVLDYLQYARLPALAKQLYSHALAREAAEDENSLQQQAQQIRRQIQLLDTQFDARLDMELALHFLRQYSLLPAEQRLPALDHYFALADGFNREIVRHKLAAIYRGTRLTDADTRLHWLTQRPQQFVQSQDSLINFAVAMHDTATQLATQRRQLNAELDAAKAGMMEVLLAFDEARGKASYAEANGSLRFSLGHVRGYQPMDAVWHQPFSSLRGLNTRDKPVVAPEQAGLAVNFLSTADSCAGYTAAPTLNTRAELVGVMFAGVKENVLADWHYDAAQSRSVHVDSRFIVWQLQQSEAGKTLLGEMQLRY